jgi:excisionase family DNA binding protein
MRKTTRTGAPKTACDYGRLLSLEEAALLLSLSPWTLRRWALQGRIASVKMGTRRLLTEKTVNDLVAASFQEPNCAPERRLD